MWCEKKSLIAFAAFCIADLVWGAITRKQKNRTGRESEKVRLEIRSFFLQLKDLKLKL
jgi:hypothetical protein